MSMVSVVLGQRFIIGAEGSSEITMNLVYGGLIVGAIGGGIAGKNKLNHASQEETEEWPVATTA